MQITETGTEGLTRKLNIVVGAADIDRRIITRLGEIAKTVKLPGFRPGKVPVSLVRQRYGQSILGEVLEETVKESSGDVIAEQKLRPALQPKIQISSFGEGQDLVYEMEVEVLPEVTPPDLKALQLDRLSWEASDEELDESLKSLSERYRKSEPKAEDAAAEEGDVVFIDYVGRIDGTEFAGGTGKDQSLELGGGQFIPGFETQLIGAKPGEERIVRVTFPADYGASDLAGKDAEFTTTVLRVESKLPAVLDDAFAETLGLENLESLRAAVRDQMGQRYEQLGRQRAKRDLLDKLAAAYSFDVPQGMVDIEFQSIWREFEAERERAKKDGTLDSEAEEPDEKLKEEYRSIAERRVRLGLLLAEIGKNANIDVSQDELNRAVAAEARRYPGQEKQVFEYFRSHPEAAQSLRAPIYEEKVVDYIFAEADVTLKPLPTKEFLAAAQMDDDEEEEPAAGTASEAAAAGDDSQPTATATE